MTLKEEGGPGFREGERFWKSHCAWPLMQSCILSTVISPPPSEHSREGISFIEASGPSKKKKTFTKGEGGNRHPIAVDLRTLISKLILVMLFPHPHAHNKATFMLEEKKKKR